MIYKWIRPLMPSAVCVFLLFTSTGYSLAAESSTSVKAAIDPSKRSTPKELLALLGQLIKARDLEAILAIHEPTASLVEFGGRIARGKDEVRKSYVNFFKMQPDLKVNALQIIEVEGVAIILGDYTLKYLDSNDETINTSGKFGDIVRQQPDGSWLYLLDNPFAP